MKKVILPLIVSFCILCATLSFAQCSTREYYDRAFDLIQKTHVALNDYIFWNWPYTPPAVYKFLAKIAYEQRQLENELRRYPVPNETIIEALEYNKESLSIAMQALVEWKPELWKKATHLNYRAKTTLRFY
jgi:hypothetical protein